jgi:hypothetical protein
MRRLPLVMLLLAAVPAFAQRTSATIRGTVTDQSGAVVSGAQVTAKSEGTGLTKTTTTNQSGADRLAWGWGRGKPVQD